MRKHNFVVGYEGEDQCIYAKEKGSNHPDYLSPLTLLQARKLSKTITCGQSGKIIKSAVFKLVKVK